MYLNAGICIFSCGGTQYGGGGGGLNQLVFKAVLWHFTEECTYLSHCRHLRAGVKCLKCFFSYGGGGGGDEMRSVWSSLVAFYYGVYLSISLLAYTSWYKMLKMLLLWGVQGGGGGTEMWSVWSSLVAFHCGVYLSISLLASKSWYKMLKMLLLWGYKVGVGGLKCEVFEAAWWHFTVECTYLSYC